MSSGEVDGDGGNQRRVRQGRGSRHATEECAWSETGEQQGVDGSTINTTEEAPENSSAPTAHGSGVSGAVVVASSTPQASQGTSTAVEQQVLTGSKRKLTSDVWEDFEKKKITRKWYAICNWCHKQFAGESTSGTSHLRSHRSICPARHAPVGPQQSILKLSKCGDGKVNLESYIFDKELARKVLALMTCVHEYPLSIVDHAGFRKFCGTLQPMFKLVSRNTIRKDIINMFEVQKNSMVKYFANFENRVAITTDLWTAGHQKRGYMAVTAHYIDASWNLKHFLMRFVYVPCPHNAEVICEALHACLVEWHLERKISTVTLDNCTSNDKAMEILPDKLETSSLMLKGSLLHMCCDAHILNLIVKDGLDVMEDGIERVRDSVAFWSATPKRHEKFENMAHLLNNEYKCRLSLDCKTRWNSTYIMLNGALQYRDVFGRLAIREKNFTCPTEEDWVFAKEVCDRLKVFFDVTELLSGTTYVTSNIFFPKICGIRLAIRKWQTSKHSIIKVMSKEMKDKFEKYWTDVHGLMAIATVLDPHYNLHMLKASFGSLYGTEHASTEVDKINKLMLDLLVEYQDVSECVGTSNVGSTPTTHSGGVDEVLDIFEQYLSSQPVAPSQVRTEFDMYLEEPLIRRTPDFDIISWWKIGGAKYPTLQKIAHDILPIPVTSVASESVFSTSGRLLSAHRSRLTPSIAEALMCMQAWSRADMLGDINFALQAIQSVLEDEEEAMDESEPIITED